MEHFAVINTTGKCTQHIDGWKIGNETTGKAWSQIRKPKKLTSMCTSLKKMERIYTKILIVLSWGGEMEMLF